MCVQYNRVNHGDAWEDESFPRAQSNLIEKEQYNDLASAGNIFAIMLR